MKVYENNNKESFEFETQGRITKQRLYLFLNTFEERRGAQGSC